MWFQGWLVSGGARTGGLVGSSLEPKAISVLFALRLSCTRAWHMVSAPQILLEWISEWRPPCSLVKSLWGDRTTGLVGIGHAAPRCLGATAVPVARSGVIWICGPGAQ